MPPVYSSSNPLIRLRRSWLLFAFGSLVSLATGAGLLVVTLGSGPALRWLVLSGMVTGYLLWVFGKNLSYNYRAGEAEILPDLGPGNLLTLLRGLLLAGVVGFWFSPRPGAALAWLPAILYGLAVGADYLDGWAARVSGRATRLGEILDMSFDGLGVLAAALLAVQWGQVPFWYLSVALARLLFVAGLALHRRRGGAVYELPHSVRRRAFAGVQMGFLVAALLPVFSPPGTHLAAALFALPFLAGFAYDWLLVTGILRPSEISTGRKGDLGSTLPGLLRLAAAGLFLVAIVQRGAGSPQWLLTLEMGVALLLLLGAAGRTAAILGMFLLGGVQYLSAPLTVVESALLVLCVAILFLGTGRFSAWTPEDRLIYRRAGERLGTGSVEKLA